MRLQVNPKPCERCGCFAFELDPERGLVCLLCSRALEPYVSTEPLLRDAPTPVYVPASVQASSGSVSRDVLRDLEDQAWALEAQHKYDSVDRRTARHEVDPARDNPIAPPRLVLLVIAAYPKWMEHQAFYGHKGPGERYGIEAHIAYAVELEGIRLPLRSRAQALEVLETRQLPRSVLPPPPRPEYDADECDALLDEIAAKSKGGAS